MAIEISELHIKVRVEEGLNTHQDNITHLNELRHYLLKECKKEIRKELQRAKER